MSAPVPKVPHTMFFKFSRKKGNVILFSFSSSLLAAKRPHDSNEGVNFGRTKGYLLMLKENKGHPFLIFLRPYINLFLFTKEVICFIEAYGGPNPPTYETYMRIDTYLKVMWAKFN